MKQILYIFGLCTLLALGFTACQQEEDVLEQINQEELAQKEGVVEEEVIEKVEAGGIEEELKKRNSDKRPKLEYSTGVHNNSLGLKKSSAYDIDGVLYVILQAYLDDSASIVLKNKDGESVFENSDLRFNNETCIQITPSGLYPYTFEIIARRYQVYGTISME